MPPNLTRYESQDVMPVERDAQCSELSPQQTILFSQIVFCVSTCQIDSNHFLFRAYPAYTL